MGWTSFLFAYLLGGITFLPLVVAAVFAHAYFTLPYRDDATPGPTLVADDLVQPGDDLDALKAAKGDAKLKATPSHHESDVAAGYFAVCREYTPMGINAKPIERSTPVGSATVASPSPSVYQTMYRSIFDRKSGPGPLDNNGGASQRPRRAGNVFYVVLRHGHLMLFDDDEQLEVRHVVSLTHHDISIYSGEAIIPEGELFIKRNAICLSRKIDGSEIGPDGRVSKPFYLFSENCSAKEDFYFALLRNQEQSYALNKTSPSPIQFDVKNIIALVQKLHSSEDHMHTRWLNAMIGRVFLGVHKTKDMENLIREKLTKKIARVKRPAFLSNIAIRGIDTGESAPYITNPRLKDLTVEGECGIEADMRYTGNFRLEVAATARIDLGSRFKVREVNLVLAVVIRKLEGHMLFKIKPPPSNRLWLSFQQAPKIEMTIEPIVSSRQITYTVILRQIESRIKEVIAETLVLPFWDDMPFFNTEHKKWRGGIFQDDTVQTSADLETVLAQEGDLEDLERLEDSNGIQDHDPPTIEKSHSVPILQKKSSVGLFGRRMSHKSKTDSVSSPSASTTSVDVRNDNNDLKSDAKSEATTSRSVPSATFVQPPAPTVGTDATNADTFKPSSSPPNESSAASAMATLTAKTQVPSSQAPNPFKPYVTSRSSHSSSSSHEATEAEKDADVTPQARRNTASSAGDDSGSKSPTLSTRSSIKSHTGSLARGFFGRRDTTPTPPTPGSPVGSDAQRRTALGTVSDVAASAKQWGLNALQRHQARVAQERDGHSTASESTVDLNQPMGRGRPLPPPGTPLPGPERSTKIAPIPVPKRKLVPPPPPPQRKEHTEPERRRPMPPPPLPKRRQIQGQEPDEDNMLVVAAPADSEPTTPLSNSPGYAQPFVEDAEELSHDTATPANVGHTGEHRGSGSVLSVEPTVGDDDDDFSAWMDNAGPEEPEVDDAVDPVKG